MLDLEHFLPYRLSVLSNRISQDIARLYGERFALGVTEWRVLAILGRHSDLSAREVAERTAMDKVAVSRAVATLLASGRIERDTDSQDRRRTALRLSPAGAEVYAEIAPLALAYEQRLLAPLDAEERRWLEHLLGRMASAELATRNR